MKNKRTKLIILLIIILLLIAGTVIAICLLNKNDKPTTKDDGTIEAEAEITTEASEEATTEATTEATEEPTTETAASTEKPSEEEPEAPTTEASTGSVDPAPTPAPKPEPAPSAPTEAPKPEPTTEAPTPAPKPEPAPSAPTTEAPAHEHSWYWVVDQAAWTEYREHEEEGYYQPTAYCKYCGQCVVDFYAHVDSFRGIDNTHAHSGSSTGTPIWVKTKDAWTETIEHPEVGHWECSCGAKK